MKRFWTEVTVTTDAGGYGVLLDGRSLKTPGKRSLALPSSALAEAVADEWRATEAEVSPAAMVLTGLANAAIDLVAADPAGFAARLSAYAESDLLCYRADYPQLLAERQHLLWEPPLQAVEQRFDIRFTRTHGVMHAAQPAQTLERIAHVFESFDPFRLAALDPIVTITGSAVLALALAEALAPAEDLYLASIVDELWQEEQWGKDAEAAARLHARQQQYAAAARFLALIDP